MNSQPLDPYTSNQDNTKEEGNKTQNLSPKQASLTIAKLVFKLHTPSEYAPHDPSGDPNDANSTSTIIVSEGHDNKHSDSRSHSSQIISSIGFSGTNGEHVASTYKCLFVPMHGSSSKKLAFGKIEQYCCPTHASLNSAMLLFALQLPSAYIPQDPSGVPNEAKRTSEIA